jgi:small subunit ribosomal protein S16
VAVKLRLMRMGKKKQPTYRVVAADSRSPRNGRFIEIVGIYDPRPDPSAIRIDNDKAVDWLRKGAQPTESVRKILEISGAWEAFSGTPSTRTAPAPKPDAKTSDTKASDTKASDTKASDTKASDTKASDTKAETASDTKAETASDAAEAEDAEPAEASE